MTYKNFKGGENMKRLEIELKNGKKCVWNENEFSEYSYDGKIMVIKKYDRWVGVYPIDALLSFEYFDK